ncbi:bifunctional tetrahydrofolate synthase/dihydrofolate synthase [Colwellia sp. MEBiC06753]
MTSNHIESHWDNWSLSQWLCYLETIHSKEIDLGLSRITQVADRLAIDLTFAKVITVAGTNGKGTTCAFIENYLLTLNADVAVYSSPHITLFNERLRLNKQDIDDKPWIAALQKVEAARGEISLTYYEFTTLAALLILQELKPQFIILEVGLGGRLDATNIVDPDVAVLTSVALDHQAFLGDTREAIGREKAGIFRANVPAVLGEIDTPHSVIAYANDIGAVLVQRELTFSVTIQPNSDNWQWQDNQNVFEHLVMPQIPLDNVATALAVLKQLAVPVDEQTINQVIAKTKVPGRTELFQGQYDVMLDVAHNPHAAKYLASHLDKLNYKKVHAVIGMLKDKDITSTLAELSGIVDNWYFTSLQGPRAATAQEIMRAAQVLGIDGNCFDNVEQGYTMATAKVSSDELVLVFGSFYTVAEIRPTLITG